MQCGRSTDPAAAFCSACGGALAGGTTGPAHPVPSEPSPVTPADWYPDPGAPGMLRYFDGSSWTGHTAPDPRAAPTAAETPSPLVSAGAMGSARSPASISSAAALPAVLGLAGAAVALAATWLDAVTAPDFGADFWSLRDATETAFAELWIWILVAVVAAVGLSIPAAVATRRHVGSGLLVACGVAQIFVALVLVSVPIRALVEVNDINDQSRAGGFDANLEIGGGVMVELLAALLIVGSGVAMLLQSRAAAGVVAARAAGAGHAPERQRASDLFLSVQGRIGRATYWIASLLLFAGFIVAIGIASAVGDAGVVLVVLAYLGLLFPSICVQGKRWHDRDKSAWWILITLIPIVGPIWGLIENGILEGTRGPNRYGPDPIAGRPFRV